MYPVFPYFFSLVSIFVFSVSMLPSLYRHILHLPKYPEEGDIASE